MPPCHRLAAPLLALAAAAAVALPAAAQSNVAVYGRVDIGVKYAPADLYKNKDKMWSVDDSSTGRIGFRGNEDLGGGLEAFFQIEHRFKGDTGAVDGSVFWKDKAWVGIQSKDWGQVRLGRMSSPQDELGVAGRYEAFFGDSYASNGTRGARSAAKWDNTVFYTSPRWDGVAAGFAVSAGEATRRRGEGVFGEYMSGPVAFAVTYQAEQDPMSKAPVGDDVRTWTLGGFYDFGGPRAMFTYARSSNLGANDQGRETVWTVGGRYPIGPGEVRVSFRRLESDKANGTDFSNDRRSNRLGLGYQYILSKRSTVNLSLVSEKVRSYKANGAVNVANSGAGTEIALRHTF
jgi:predicted porin